MQGKSIITWIFIKPLVYVPSRSRRPCRIRRPEVYATADNVVAFVEKLATFRGHLTKYWLLPILTRGCFSTFGCPPVHRFRGPAYYDSTDKRWIVAWRGVLSGRTLSC